MTRRFCLTATAFAFALHQLAAAPSLDAAKLHALQAIVAAEVANEKIPGLTIAIGRGTDLVWTAAFGFTDVENGLPAKPGSVFRTASIAKPITAAAVLQLVERGKIDLDAPVSTYVPSFPSKAYPVTVRQVLGHLGGIRHYKDAQESFSTKHYRTVLDSLEAFAADDLVNEPGAKMTYSTYGYVLLGAVVEGASGTSFMDFLRTNILGPAGMTSTYLDDVYAIIPNRSRGYGKNIDGRLYNSSLHDTSGKVPGGGLLSTSADLVRFVQAIDSGKLLKQETVAQMLTSLRTSDGRTTGYGLGWGIDEWSGRARYGHSGGQAGTSTQIYYIPSEHLAVAVMCNLESVRLTPLIDRVLSAVLHPGVSR